MSEVDQEVPVVHDGYCVAESRTTLETEVAQLRAALRNRQLLGLVNGLVAERYGLTPDQGWAQLVAVSQHCNVKVIEVARVINDGFCGRLAEEDHPLAERLNAAGPAGRRPLVPLGQPS